MTRFTFLFASFFATCIANAQSLTRFTGTWEGKLDLGVSLRIVFHIGEDNGHLIATGDSPDQSAYGLRCDTVIVNQDSITIEMRMLHAKVAGRLISDSVINGTFSQLTSVPVVLKKGTGETAAIRRPQTPHPPFPYKSEDIVFNNADGTMQYGATITIPPGKGPFPAALLITGSGPQDRDETILGHKPFWVIADALTKNGFVVLRVDDRGVGKSSGVFGLATTADFANDAAASFNYLLSRPEVNKKKAGLIGHSEGGMIAPMIASQRSDVDFIVLLAGPGEKLESLMLEQNNAVFRSMGISEKAINAYMPLFKKLMDQAVASTDTSVISAVMLEDVRKWKETTDPALQKEMGIGEGGDDRGLVTTLMQQFHNSWFRYFINFDPGPYLENLHCKVLALNGSRDIQVVASSNLAGIEAAFKKSGLKSYTIKEMPGLNHLFQACTKCTVAEYGELEETFALAALLEINTWLNKNVK